MYRYTHSGHDIACLWLRSGEQDCAAKVSSFHMVSDPILLNFVLCSPDYLQIIGVCLALVLLGNGFGASLLHLHCTILNGSQFSLGYSRERLSVLPLVFESLSLDWMFSDKMLWQCAFKDWYTICNDKEAGREWMCVCVCVWGDVQRARGVNKSVDDSDAPHCNK